MIEDTNTYQVHPMVSDAQIPQEFPQEEAPVESVPAASESAPYVDNEVGRNFAQLRKERNRIAQEKDALERRLAQYEQQAQRQASPVEEDEEIPLGDEDIAEGKHVKQLVKEQKRLKAELETFKAKASEDITESRIRARFPDYYSVVNEETLTALTEEDPELAYTIQSSPDFYNKAILAYKEIKKRGIVPDARYDADKKRAKENAAKPRPLVSASPKQGESPLSHANAFANGLTSELKASLWKEMQDASKHSSMPPW
jgi:hypothetical protein